MNLKILLLAVVGLLLVNSFYLGTSDKKSKSSTSTSSQIKEKTQDVEDLTGLSNWTGMQEWAQEYRREMAAKGKFPTPNALTLKNGCVVQINDFPENEIYTIAFAYSVGDCKNRSQAGQKISGTEIAEVTPK